MSSARPEERWRADRELGPDLARELVATQLPEVEASTLSYLGAGWEFDVYETRDGWVFRFPRRLEFADGFERERGLLEVARRLVGGHVLVPSVELEGRPAAGFPYPFTGHRKVPGVPADHPAVTLGPAFDRDVAGLLTKLHRAEEGAAATAILERDVEEHEAWLAEASEAEPRLHDVGEAVDGALSWLATAPDVPPPAPEPLRVVHNDLCPDHLLVDLDTGRLVGVIDWTDMALGDPALDFIGLAAWGGWPFVLRVLEQYEVPVDDLFLDRVAFGARVRTLHWLDSAIRQGDDTEKHVRWVANAFGVPVP